MHNKLKLLYFIGDMVKELGIVDIYLIQFPLKFHRKTSKKYDKIHDKNCVQISSHTCGKIMCNISVYSKVISIKVS